MAICGDIITVRMRQAQTDSPLKAAISKTHARTLSSSTSLLNVKGRVTPCSSENLAK